MGISRRSFGLLLTAAGALLLAGPSALRVFAHPGTGARRSGAAPGRSAAVGAPSAAPAAAAAPAQGGGQDQAPNRRDFTITAKDFHYSPERVEVTQDDLVKLTIRSEDLTHTFALDEYRIARRVPAGGSATLEFRADRPGTFPFYCNLTSDSGHAGMKGQFVVRPK